jgi:hypothetical protein
MLSELPERQLGSFVEGGIADAKPGRRRVQPGNGRSFEICAWSSFFAFVA